MAILALHTYHRWAVPILLLLLLACAGFRASSNTAQAQAQPAGPIYHIELDGVITTVSASYVQRVLRLAEASDASLLLIELRSEGAVLRAVRPLALALAEADVPVVVYIAPAGTQSGAGGTFLLSASHIAAMSPDTSFGSATALTQVDSVLSEQTRTMLLQSATDQLRNWNARQGRNTDWIDRAVREGVVMTNEQASALHPPAINLVAGSHDELLTLLHGRNVVLTSGQQHQLSTLGRQAETVAPTAGEQVLLLLANPTIMFFLLVMGCVAIYAELLQPGITLFAAMGIILFAGALVGLIVLPVRWISVVGLLLAFALIAADIFVPSHGGLTLTGLALMLTSSLTLIDTAQAPRVFIAVWAIVMVALFIAIIAALAIWFIVRSRSQPIATGEEGLVGRLAEVRKRLAPEGMVFVDGALWRAICDNGEADVGDWVRVREVHDLRLIVSRPPPNENKP